jgi:uncharacterized MAPEG superfamily protein
MTGVTALIGFTAWTLLLVLIVFNWRFFEVLRGKPANSWGRGIAAPSPPFIVRVEHAHANCLENLPVFAALVLGAVALDKRAVIDLAGPFVLYFRLAQSACHLAGTSHWLVFVRANFFMIQWLLFAYMAWSLLA